MSRVSEENASGFIQSLGVDTSPFISVISDPGSQTSFSSRKGHLLAATWFQKDLLPAAWPVSFPTLHRSRERAEKEQDGHRVRPAVATKLETAPESIEMAPRGQALPDFGSVPL